MRARIAIFIFLVTIGLHGKSLKKELADQQQTTGLTLASFSQRQIDFFGFCKKCGWSEPLPQLTHNAGYGVLSRDASRLALAWSTSGPSDHLAIVNRDGSGWREFPQIASPGLICWSHDNSRLVMTAEVTSADAPSPHRALILFDLATGRLEQIGRSGAQVTAQCWSPDGSQIVYSLDGKITILSLQSKEHREIAEGQNATWSPSGEWIAFYDGDKSYRLVKPSGEGERSFFKVRKDKTPSELVWSPDSKLVAYADCCYLFPLDPSNDTAKLRVRRVSGGRSKSVSWGSGTESPGVWVSTRPRTVAKGH